MKFNEKKAAHIAAFFIYCSGGSIHVLKLMKLMYLSERESFARYGEPLTGDKPVSMRHGPVLSTTLDLINSFIPSVPEGWEYWISDRENHMLGLNIKVLSTKELTQLSDAELEILENIWNKYGGMDRYQLRDLTHKLCEEWEDPNGSSLAIPYSRILKCVGYSTEEAKELENRINEKKQIDDAFESVSTG